jgi:hypothetical protein
MASAQQSIKKKRAKRALDRAMNGDLAEVGEYPVSYNGSYRSVLPPAFFTNVGAGAGSDGKMFMDVSNECLVIVYGDG